MISLQTLSVFILGQIVQTVQIVQITYTTSHMVLLLADSTVRAVDNIINGKQRTPGPAYAFTELFSKQNKMKYEFTPVYKKI